MEQHTRKCMAKPPRKAGLKFDNNIGHPPAMFKSLGADRGGGHVSRQGQRWGRPSRAEQGRAGQHITKLDAVQAGSHVHGDGWGGVQVGPGEWGAVLCRGGYLVQSWDNPKYKRQLHSEKTGRHGKTSDAGRNGHELDTRKPADADRV